MTRTHHLANGVAVICDPAPGFETLALSVVAGRGARFEDPGRSGWSHLLEHMVFKGAGVRSAREIVEVIEAAGGQINAATGQERTSFQVRALAGGLPLAMDVAGDLVLRPTLDGDDLVKEIRVVGQEIAEAADTPDDQVFELANAAAFADQALGRPILGRLETIGAATPAGLAEWRAEIYAPDRIVVSAAGAVDEDELLRLSDSLFAADPARRAPRTAEAARFTGGRAREKRRLEQAHLVFLLPAGGVVDPDYWPLRLFAEILGGGMSSRLFQEAREKLGLAYAVDAWMDAWSDAGVLGVYAGCAARDAARLAALTGREIRSLAAGPAHAELERAKAQLKSGLFMSRESLATRAEQSAAQMLAFGRVLTTREIGEAIEAVSETDLARIAGRLLASARSASAVLGPAAASTASAAFEDALFG